MEATFNKATGWLHISFDDIPSVETRNELKNLGFRYEPYSKRWRASFSPEREALLKTLAGSIQEINIHINYGAKAEYAATMASKHDSRADDYQERADKISDAIPFGQPILVGHHSERHHRADLNRINNVIHKTIEEREIADKYENRAERYNKLAQGESPVTISNRIKKLEADKRRMMRELEAGESGIETLYYSGKISEKRKEEINNWIKFYSQRLEVEYAKYKSCGGLPSDSLVIKPGDIIKTRFFGNAKVLKVNDKTLRIEYLNPALSSFKNYSIDKGEIVEVANLES